MANTVITLGEQTVTTLLRGTDQLPSGDLREIRFRCDFSADAVNGGRPPAPKPQIRVTVETPASAGDVQVHLVPPGRPPEVLYASRGSGPVSWAPPIVKADGAVRSLPPEVARRALSGSGWVYQSPFPEAPGNPTPPPVPPGRGGTGGSQTLIRYLDPAADPVGIWRVRVHYQGSQDAQVLISVSYPETIQVLHETRISFELINRAFRQAMLAVGLRVELGEGQARVTFDQQFKALTGLKDLIFSVPYDVDPIELIQYNIEMANEGGVPVIRAGFDLSNSKIEVPGPDIDIENLAILLRLVLSYGYAPGPDFFETAMRHENGNFSHHQMSVIPFLDAHPRLAGFWIDLANVVLALVGKNINDYIQPVITEVAQQLETAIAVSQTETYFYDAVIYLAERDHVMHSLTADDSGLIVQHHRLPSAGVITSGPLEGDSEGDAALAEAGPDIEDAPADDLPAGARPGGPASTARRLLDWARARGPARETGNTPGIDHIVFLMLENRSFDHMLGYRGLASREVDGLSGTESNLLAAGTPPYQVFHLLQKAGIPSPDHGFDVTKEQIDGGRMSGFVKSYSQAHGAIDPSLVMGYYTGAELPMYKFLADNFAICDHWHSSHPGETQCNRFCAITGRTPEVDNLDLADPRIAYYDGITIFDHLTALGIDWAYVEGNIGFLRMFDKYRLDVHNVIPFSDIYLQGIRDTFERRVTSNQLPSVTFIDPRFIDVPPRWNANDDLPPADVCQGQALVRDVYTMLSTAATWSRTLLVITYDERGGFFDHVAPPGSPLSADPTPVPRVHPDGADFYGVRVPAFVVSPWVDAGTVIHATFDHTSILKTILERFAPSGYPIADAFGDRTAQANGLLASLRPSARTDVPAVPKFPECDPPLGNPGPAGSDSFENSMLLLPVPAMYRGRISG